jgi:hypothetical protein
LPELDAGIKMTLATFRININELEANCSDSFEDIFAMNYTPLTGSKRKVILVYLALLTCTAVNSSVGGTLAHGETFVGKAVNSQGILEYVEHHTVAYRNGTVSDSQTMYYDANDNKIGELISHYSFGPQFGSYDFTDIRAQYQDGAKVAPGRIWVFRKQSPEKTIEGKYLAKEKGQIVGQGFHQFIVRNLEHIAQGEVFHVMLVLPSRLDQYEFRIRKRKIDGDTLYIRVEIDNWFLRLFAPHVDVDYDLKHRRLLRYEGISNLEDTSGNHTQVTITYSYVS